MLQKLLQKSNSKNSWRNRSLIENEIADKTTSIAKSKINDKTKEAEEIYIPTEKGQQTIDDLKHFSK